MYFKSKIDIEESWGSYIQKFDRLNKQQEKRLPNFFIISPPKTGSTWLSHNLNCHPEIFIPDVKEIKYFSNHWLTEDIRWYLKHFEKGINKKKGDASPSYALLPIKTIRLIRSLMPELKLIFLMRDPVDRSWSHAKHSYRYKEPGFKSYTGDFSSISDESLIDIFMRDWFIAFGDYFGCLKRWLAVFPKDRFYLGFHDSIRDNPKKILIEIFEFLGTHKKVDWAQFKIYERIFDSTKKESTDNIKIVLKLLHQKRTLQLAQFLKKEFDIDIPAYWKNTLSETNKPFNTSLIEETYQGLNTYKNENQFYAGSQKDIIKISLQNENMNYNKRVIGNTHCENGELEKKQLPMMLKERYLNLNKKFTSKSNKLDFSFDTLRREFTDNQLEVILNMDNSPAPPVLWGGFLGSNIVRYKGEYYALSKTLGKIDLPHTDDEKLKHYKKKGYCVIGNSLLKIKTTVILLIIKKILINLKKSSRKLLLVI